jgi:hypothetical protein
MPARQPRGSGFKVTSVQPTPNPNALKFLLNRPITETTLSARTTDQAAGHPLMEQLFSVPGVTGVLLLGDFVTINRSPESNWADIKKGVRRILQSQ